TREDADRRSSPRAAAQDLRQLRRGATASPDARDGHRRNYQLSAPAERLPRAASREKPARNVLNGCKPGILADSRVELRRVSPLAPAALQRVIQTEPDRPRIERLHDSCIALELRRIADTLAIEKCVAVGALVFACLEIDDP